MDHQQIQASQSSVGTNVTTKYTNEDVVSLKQHNRKASLFANFDLCNMRDGTTKARCKRCGMFLQPGANSTLEKHWNTTCKMLGSDSTQPTLGSDGSIFIYEPEAVRLDFARFVIQQGLPFNHFDNPRLTEIIKQRLQPRYSMVSRSSLRRDAFNLWKTAKNEIIEGFRNYNYNVSLTSDVWTAPHGTGYSYLALTAHWFNPDSWLLMKRTIAFKPFAYPHTGNNLRKVLYDTLVEYNLHDKVFCISLDNASNNTNGMKTLKIALDPVLDGAFFHSRCVAHIINLAVQNCLEECGALRDKFKNLILTIYKSSQQRLQNYRVYRVNHCKQQWLGPNLDMPTRWNSTYNMFQNIIRQRDTLVGFNQKLVQKGLSSESYLDHEWDQLIQLTDFLKVFKEATEKVSGVYYPTSPLVLTQLFIMTAKLDEFKGSRSRSFRKMVYLIKKKLVKYFSKIPYVFTCSAALNPFISFGGVQALIIKILTNLDCEYGPDPKESVPSYISNQVQDFNQTFERLFEIYATKYGQQGNPIVDSYMTGGASSSSAPRDINITMFNIFVEEGTKRQRTSSPTSELGIYKAQNFMRGQTPEAFQNLDILAWWKSKESQYPILAAMARDLFAVQASTVASESAFSSSGRIISDRRSRLTNKAVEVCVCLKDYLDGVDRIQHETSLEGPLVDDVIEEGLVNEDDEGGISPTSTNETEVEEGEYDPIDYDIDEVPQESFYRDDLDD